MSPEIELKLAMTPEILGRLRRHALLRSLAGGRRLRRQSLISLYYDTADRRLAKAGIALRVRGDGKRFLQTLKAPPPADAAGSGGLQRLIELEAPVPGEQPDLSLITEPTLAALLAEPGVGDALVPVFTTRFERHTLLVHLLDSDIEVAFDRGQVEAGAVAEAICEAELELKSGKPERLWQLALALLDSVAFQLETRSKAARGHALAAGESPTPTLATRLELDGEATAGQACLAVLRNALTQLHANARAVLAGCADPEAIHQLRVAVRRLRAALSLFRPILADSVADWLAGEFDWLQAGLGSARDWDVFVLETLEPLHRRLPDESGLGALETRAEAQRRASRLAAEAVLRAPRTTRLLLQLELWLEDGSWRRAAEPGALVAAADEPAGVFARQTLAHRSRQLLKRGRRRDEADEDSLHALRIAGKKLRYAVEFFRTLLPKGQAKAALDSLRALQDCLGSLNDAAVGQRLLAGMGESSRKPTEAKALGIVVGWQTGRIDTDLGHLRRTWKQAKKALAPLAEG